MPETIAHILNGFQLAAFDPFNLLLMALGTFLGLIVGALPGFSSPMAIVILLPITYHLKLPAISALLLMMGVYCGTKCGGSYPAVLLRTPGTPAGACTALDGYPMAQRGEAGKAIGYAIMGSTFGGIFGWIIAVIFVPVLGKIAVNSRPEDLAVIGMLGLTMVSAFVRGNMIRGLIGVFVGLLIGTIGQDANDGAARFTFGINELGNGIPFAAALVGFFGMAVVLSDIKEIGSVSELVSQKVSLVMPKLREVKNHWKCMTIGALYGTLIGAIPGVGAEGSTWVAYATVKNKDKDPDRFGQGAPEGILTPESCNNANNGGTMVPMLTLGIPGDGSTAIMLGALVLYGVDPGVTLMRDQPALVYALLAGLLLSTVAMFFIAWFSCPMFIHVLKQDRAWLFPFILVLATLGAFSCSNSMYPVYVALVFGAIGYVFELCGISVVPIVLGIILGPVIEANARMALITNSGDWLVFVNSWWRAGMLAIMLCLLASNLVKIFKKA
ncbi:MAG: tripartite tricarboxylate transporter permease [Mailhella sp.]|nr:tripartite tricarboxylate transporter permease [Mailhella sp.]